MVKPEELDFWIKNKFNVLFIGQHGVGKTSLVTQAFERSNLKWKSFSAATMDPWVDFIGVPRSTKNENGLEYLELIRPKEFAEDEIEALFFDEYNRSSKKIRNSVMELIQFKSINGKKFKNLKIVWAAINPHDEEETYDVEKIDPAQLDRFQIHVELKYECNLGYFVEKFGDGIGRTAVDWWNELDQPVKVKISPRRLDYALEMYNLKGDLRYILPKDSNIHKLLSSIGSGPIIHKLRKFLADKDVDGATKFFESPNNITASIPYLTFELFDFLCPLMPSEWLCSLLSSKKHFLVKACKLNSEKVNAVIRDLYYNSNNAKNKLLVEKYGRHVLNTIDPALNTKIDPDYYNPHSSNLQAFTQDIVRYLAQHMNTADRIDSYFYLQKNMPQHLDATNANHVFQLVIKIFLSSHGSTLNKMPFLIGMINHCINQSPKLRLPNNVKFKANRLGLLGKFRSNGK